MPEVYLCLGSNWADAPQQLARARAAIAALKGVAIAGASRAYRTEPQGFAEQPWFHNQALRLLVAPFWTPRKLMTALLGIEKKLGRKRGPLRFGPRCIDLDILLYDNAQSPDPFCTLPHPRLFERAFALLPLRELAPDLDIGGKTAAQWLARLDWRLDGDRIFQ